MKHAATSATRLAKNTLSGVRSFLSPPCVSLSVLTRLLFAELAHRYSSTTAKLRIYIMSTSLDSGHTAWILQSMAMVQLMLPGLAFFYAGLLHRTSVVTMIMYARSLIK